MAIKVGWTQADIDTLRKALAAGVLTVSYSGPPSRTVTYQSAADLRRTLAAAVAEVNGTTTIRYAKTSKGV